MSTSTLAQHLPRWQTWQLWQQWQWLWQGQTTPEPNTNMPTVQCYYSNPTNLHSTMQLATLSSAMMRIWEDATPPGLPNPKHATPSNTNTLWTTKTAAQFGTIFQQLWILIHQLEELNIQFSEFLQTLPILPLSRMIPCKPSAELLTQSTQLKQHPNNNIPTLMTSLLPTQAAHHLTCASYHCLPRGLPPWPLQKQGSPSTKPQIYPQ